MNSYSLLSNSVRAKLFDLFSNVVRVLGAGKGR